MFINIRKFYKYITPFKSTLKYIDTIKIYESKNFYIRQIEMVSRNNINRSSDLNL